MSIEKTFERIADALEIIAGVMDDKAEKSFAAEVPMPVETGSVEHKKIVKEVPAPVVEVTNKTGKPVTVTATMEVPAPVVETPAPVEVPAKIPAPVAPLPEAPTDQMSLEELNAGFVAEFHRLGGDADREGVMDLINGIIKGFGVGSANELAPADYQEVLDKVKALK